MPETEANTTVEQVHEQVNEEVHEQVDEKGSEDTATLNGFFTANTFNAMKQEIINVIDEEDEKSLDEQVSAIFEFQTNPCSSAQDQTKFVRIRTSIQKLSKDFEAALYEREQRHKEELKLREEEIKRITEKLESQEAKNEVLEYKVKTLLAHEQENAILVKRAGEKVKKLEATEENHKAYVKMAGERISAMESQSKARAERADEKIRMMEAREEKVLALAKKAAIKIKDLETDKKKQTANAKLAVQNINSLKEMLVCKQKDMENLKEKALKEYEKLAQELAKAIHQKADLQVALAQTKQQYKKEHEMRKSDQKKISSLRKMIEQYDGGVEPAWSELSQAMSEEEDPTDPLVLYRNSTFVDQDQFDTVKNNILEHIPEETKMYYGQVGFFNAGEYHFPVLALGPFDVPPGTLREKWLENAKSSLGVYCFGQEDVSTAYDMIPTESFIPYEFGVENNFHVLPASILEKKNSDDKLSPIEEVMQEGINKVNEVAQKSPQDRDHPLKSFEEEFVSEMVAATDGAVIDELRSKFRETICASLSSDDGLPGEIDNIVTELNKIKDHAKVADSKTLTVDVDADDNQSCTSTTSLDNDSCADTMTSLEEQMQKFMHELAASKAANKKVTTPMQPATSPRKFSASPHSYVPVQQQTAAAPEIESRDETPEVRDEAPASTPGKSLVQQRLKMFGGNTAKAPRPTVIPERGAKNVMKMWQMKAAGKIENSTPKQANTTTPSAESFTFDEDKQGESPEIKALEETKTKSGTEQSQSTTRCVTIPKNILKKIEAGEALTEEEREILEGIQKFNKSGKVEDIVVEQQSSFVSGVTIDGSCAEGNLEVTVE